MLFNNSVLFHLLGLERWMYACMPCPYFSLSLHPLALHLSNSFLPGKRDRVSKITDLGTLSQRALGELEKLLRK